MSYIKETKDLMLTGKLSMPDLIEGSSEAKSIAVEQDGTIVKSTVSASDTVTSITGDIVDNADPNNPVINNPTWLQVDDKPTTFTPSAHNQAFTTITGVATAAQIPVLPASKITSGTFEIAQTNSVLTGLGAGTNTTVLATDTLLAAIAKLQAQITALQIP